MNTIILPVASPTITTLTGYADALAILQSREEALDWVYSNYLQFYITKAEIVDINAEYYPTAGYAPCFFGDFDNRRLANAVADGIFLNREACPHLNVFEMPNDLLLSYNKSFVTHIKKCIERSMYVYGHADVSKISVYKISEEGADHPVLIYGYDDDKQIFHFADFIENDTFTFATATYGEIEDAFQGAMRLYLPLVKSIAAVEFVSDASFTFQFSHIRDTVSEYLTPDPKQRQRYTDYSASYFAPLKWKMTSKIGVDAYDFLSDFYRLYLSLRERGVETIDIRPFHAFYDHKNMMCARLAHFVKRGYISEGKREYIDGYEKVREWLLTVRNLVLKYNLNRAESELSGVDALLGEARTLEIELLKNIFEV
jgi:hypothetical protein